MPSGCSEIAASKTGTPAANDEMMATLTGRDRLRISSSTGGQHQIQQDALGIQPAQCLKRLGHRRDMFGVVPVRPNQKQKRAARHRVVFDDEHAARHPLTIVEDPPLRAAEPRGKLP
jgi:hypothetical protein